MTWRDNPEAFNAAWRAWYRRNAQRKMAWQRRRRQELQRWWRELKASKPCEVCREADPVCLHFHHDDPATKAITLADAIANGWSKRRILDEIAKCRVLCANCHAKHHWEE